MKVAISSKGADLDAEVDPRFGRAAYIVIVDDETLEFEAIDNFNNANSFKGAGIQAATLISDRGAKVLMTGHTGPNAFTACDAAGIKMVNNTSGTLREALARLKAGDCVFADAANVEGQW